MKLKKTTMVGLLAFSMLGTAFAAPPNDDDSEAEQQHSHELKADHDESQHDHSPRYQQDHQAYREDLPRPYQNWHEGDRVPPKYRDRDYYIDDWRARELPPPPPDHRWLLVNGDYVLVAIATGVITQILLGGH
ncbi:MAG: RcnB family protein [Acinetobacter sp.]